MASTTTVMALPYPDNGDVPNVAGDFAALANGADAKVGLVKISEQSGATLSFTGIPATFRHLRLVGSAKMSGITSANLGLRMNNDSAANYNWTYLATDLATGPTRTSGTNDTKIQIGRIPLSAGNELLDFAVDIISYREVASTGVFFKATGLGQIEMADGAARWASTATVSRLDLVPSASTLGSTCRVCLYGVL